MTEKKVLHISEEYPIRIAQIMGKMNSGGVESFIMNYYRNINRDKIQFDFIVDNDSLIPQKEEIEKLGGRIIKIPPYQHIFKYMISLIKIFKNNDYKIVHSHLNTLSIFPLFCAKLAKVPTRIAHSHSTSNKKEKFRNVLKSILKPFSKIFATNYFACSEHAGRWLFGNKAFEDGRVIILTNAIDTEKFKFNTKVRKKIREELNITDKFIIGHVGRFNKQKNHEFLIETFKEVYKERKDAVLLLIGEGPLEEDIKRKVKNMNLEKVVYFLGTKDNVNDYMQAMDIFCFPSLYEGLGMVAIEAQINNLYVIASNEIPKEAEISNKIIFLSLNKDIWKENILNLKYLDRENIELDNSNYEIHTASKKLEKIYMGLLGFEE